MECPTPEALAAWIDAGLGAADRAWIDAHLMGCCDCRALVGHVIDIQIEAGAEAAPSRAGLSARRAGRTRDTLSVIGWGVVALAAAVVMVAVLVLPSWRAGPVPSTADTELADLAETGGQVRTVEARLTGGFRHGPFRAPLRSGGSAVPMDYRTLRAAAGRIREVTEAHRGCWPP